MAWLRMPRPVLEAYAANLPTVQAIEMLADIGASRIAGAGRMKLAAAKQAQRKLAREADKEKRPADPDKLRAAGIGVEGR